MIESDFRAQSIYREVYVLYYCLGNLYPSKTQCTNEMFLKECGYKICKENLLYKDILLPFGWIII